MASDFIKRISHWTTCYIIKSFLIFSADTMQLWQTCNYITLIFIANGVYVWDVRNMRACVVISVSSMFKYELLVAGYFQIRIKWSASSCTVIFIIQSNCFHHVRAWLCSGLHHRKISMAHILKNAMNVLVVLMENPWRHKLCVCKLWLLE